MILLLILAPMAAACLIRLVGLHHKKLRDSLLRLFTFAMMVGAGAVLYRVVAGGDMVLNLPEICAMGLSFHVDGFRALYVFVASFMWFMTTMLSGEYFAHYHNRGRYYFFLLLTYGGVVGMFYAGDLFTAFIFFEIMSMASYPWVAHEETPGAMRAAATYLGVAVLGGMVTLMGLFMLWNQLGSLSFEALRAAGGNKELLLPSILVLFGFFAKAGVFPMHIWLPKAHPVAPAPASALLSGMLTKAGMFGIIGICMNLYLGDQAFGSALLAIGLVTMLAGAVLALFSTNLKRTLACSSMSQIGYILTGLSAALLLGEHAALPAAGALTHMVNHSLLKLVLFMAAGVIYMNIHQLDLNKIRGFGRGKWLLHAAFLLGAVGLAGVPLFNVYISKTMIHEGLVEYIVHLQQHGGNWLPYKVAEWVFLFAAGITTAYMLKLYICIFWQKNRDAALQQKYDALNGRYMKVRSAFALTASAALIPVLGIFNQLQMSAARLSAPFFNVHPVEDVAFYSFINLKGGAITLGIGTLLYLFVVRTWMYSKKEGYIDRWPKGFDLEDALYRPLLCRFLPWAAGLVFGPLNRLMDSRLVTVYLAGAASWLFRIFDETVDTVILFVRELLFVKPSDVKRERSHSVFIALAGNIVDGILSIAHFLRPSSGSKRSVYDMRYGNQLSNSISFGLLLVALGLVVAIAYVFVRQGVI